MIPDYRSRRAMPSLWAILVLAGCCASSMVITYRARAAQADADKPAATATQAPAPSKDTPAKDTAAKDTVAKDAPTKERPPASKAEESATIEDDPTLVPDSKENADNNVTFPIDI
jgi:hypothetical protein